MKPLVVEQTGLMEWREFKDVGGGGGSGWRRGGGSGVVSCFNCLRSLAESLGLECCVISSLAPSHSLARSLSPCSPSDGRAARGKILSPDCRVSKTEPNITSPSSQSQLFSLSHSFLSPLEYVSV